MNRTGNEFDRFCREAVDLLAAARVEYLIIGGLAVLALGDPRMTGDVDVIAFITAVEADHLLDMGARAGFEIDLDTERTRLEQTGTLRLRRGRFQLDVIVASLPFEAVARARARKRRLFGRMVPLPTAEDLILFKVLAGRDKDLIDGSASLGATALRWTAPTSSEWSSSLPIKRRTSARGIACRRSSAEPTPDLAAALLGP